MQEKFYVDVNGKFLGTFIGREFTDENGNVTIVEAEVPAGAIEVSSPPEDARQIWDGNAWTSLNEIAFYAELRAVSYPSIGDQLDAVFKGGAAFDEMQLQIQAVKARYPKGV